MNDHDIPVTEDELHAFVDGQLPHDRRVAVENWLAAHAEDAARVRAWREQADALRARYADVVTEVAPRRLALDRLAVGAWHRFAATAAAAAIAAFLVGGLSGWWARGATAAMPSPEARLTTEALDAHRLYVAEVRHPIEVRGGEQHLLPWLSRRVGTALRTPELGAFDLKLLGGRLLPGPSGAAALLMYESPKGERFTVYCSRLRGPQTALRYAVAGDVAAFHWIDGEFGYVVSGPAERERLRRVTQAVYDDLENRAPAQRRSDADQPASPRGS